MLTLIPLAWRNMWRNWRRTAIAATAIVLGLILLIFMDALIQGSDQAIFGNAVRLYGGNIQVHAVGYRDRASRLPLLPVEDVDVVIRAAQERPEVVSASKRINTGGMVSSRVGTYPVVITGIEPSVEAPYSLVAESISEGRFLDAADENTIVIGRGLADLLGVEVGERVNLLGRRRNETMRQRTMTVVGVYDLGLAEAEKGTVFVNLADAQTLYNLRDQQTEVAISLDRVGQEQAVIEGLRAELPGYEVDSWETLRPEIRDTLAVKSMVTNAFGLIVLLIASIGILNLMLMAVFERTREMGVLSALGMKNRQVMALFLLEGTFIGVVGAVSGCLLGWALVWAVGQVGINIAGASQMGDITALMGDRLYPVIGASDVIVRGIAVVIIAALASLFPAWQASRGEPAAALHYI